MLSNKGKITPVQHNNIEIMFWWLKSKLVTM